MDLIEKIEKELKENREFHQQYSSGADKLTSMACVYLGMVQAQEDILKMLYQERIERSWNRA